MILTELEPLTPDRASSILSCIYCEKLKSTPGNSSANSRCNCSTSLSLVKPEGHSSNGLSGANNSTLEKGEASLPSSGLPCCDTTVMISGCRSKISRILCAAGSPASRHGSTDYPPRGRAEIRCRAALPALPRYRAIPGQRRALFGDGQATIAK